MADDPNLFEMRRLEQLSNTVFGVAMTLLAYDLPRGVSVGATPTWHSLADVYVRPLIALGLSFVIAGVFWMSHHRRLQRAPYASRWVVMLNIFFLMSIVALPATNGLYGAYRMNSTVAVVYFGHIALIAGLNTLLWFITLNRDATARPFLSSLATVGLALTATGVAAISPAWAAYPMLLAFVLPLISWRTPKDDAPPPEPS